MDCSGHMSLPRGCAGSSIVRTTSISLFHRRSPDHALGRVRGEIWRLILRLRAPGRRAGHRAHKAPRSPPARSKGHPKRCGYGPPLQGEGDEQRASDEADRPQRSPHRVVGGMLRVFLLVDQREAGHQYRGKAVKTPPIDSVVTAPISAATTEIVPPKAKRTAMSL